MASTNPHVTAHICLQPKILARLLSLPVVQDICSSLQPLQAPWSSLSSMLPALTGSIPGLLSSQPWPGLVAGWGPP